jgi:hypothetical protein
MQKDQHLEQAMTVLDQILEYPDTELARLDTTGQRVINDIIANLDKLAALSNPITASHAEAETTVADILSALTKNVQQLEELLPDELKHLFDQGHLGMFSDDLPPEDKSPDSSQHDTQARREYFNNKLLIVRDKLEDAVHHRDYPEREEQG